MASPRGSAWTATLDRQHGASAAALAWKSRLQDRNAASSSPRDTHADHDDDDDGNGYDDPPASLRSMTSPRPGAADGQSVTSPRSFRSSPAASRLDDRGSTMPSLPPAPPSKTRLRGGGRGAARFNVQLVVDLSPGMAGRSLDVVSTAVGALVSDALQEYDCVGVLGFNGGVRVLQRLSPVGSCDVTAALRGASTASGTRLWDAMMAGLDELEGARPSQEVCSELVRAVRRGCAARHVAAAAVARRER